MLAGILGPPIGRMHLQKMQTGWWQIRQRCGAASWSSEVKGTQSAGFYASPGDTTRSQKSPKTQISSALCALNCHRHPHAATDAESGDAAFGFAPEHFVQKCHCDPGSGAADGMAEGDGP